MNKTGKMIFQILLILFFSLYISKYTVTDNENKKILTEKAILEYEQDLKEGKDITSKNYQIKEKNYNNKMSNLGRNLSKVIEKVFNKSFDTMIKYLNYLRDNE